MKSIKGAFLVGILAALALAMGSSFTAQLGTAEADGTVGPHCGDVLDGGHHVLQHNLNCTNTTPNWGIKLIKGAHLSMNGFGVTCSGPQACIILGKIGAPFKSGDGGSRVTEGSVTGGSQFGILVQNSNKNRVTDMIVTGAGNTNIFVRSGTHHTIADNTVTGSAFGIGLNESNKQNKVTDNTVSGAGAFDLKQNGGSCGNNKWRDNTFTTSDLTCIQ